MVVKNIIAEDMPFTKSIFEQFWRSYCKKRFSSFSTFWNFCPFVELTNICQLNQHNYKYWDGSAVYGDVVMCEGNEEHVSSPPPAGWVLEIEFWSLLQFQHCPPKYYILLSLQHYFRLRTLYTGSSMNLLYWCLLRNFTLLLLQNFPRLDVAKTLQVTLLHQR